MYSNHRDGKSQYDRYAQNPQSHRDLSGHQRQRTSSGSSYSRDYPELTSGAGARELQSILRSSGSSGHYHQDSRSSYSSFNTMTAGSRSMSHSYLDVQDLNSETEEMMRGHGAEVMDRGRLRHQSLTYGVSEADLERAARTVMTSEPGPAPFSLAMPLREGRGKIQTRHSLPDLFEVNRLYSSNHIRLALYIHTSKRFKHPGSRHPSKGFIPWQKLAGTSTFRIQGQ